MNDPGRKILVLASGNPGKLAELTELLAPLGFNLRPQSDWQVPEAIEDASTFLENALIKARNAARVCALPVVADDSGLVVPALDGAPGIQSARYAGMDATDKANNRKLLQAMDGFRVANRLAFFHCVMVLMRSATDPAPLVAGARWWGEIGSSETGSGGFGYDPLFWLPDMNCTSAELPPEEKNRLSHRGCAARRLVELLRAEHESYGWE